MRLFALLLLCTFMISCTIDPCGNKDQLITNIESLLDETKDQASDYKQADWNKVEERFQKLTKDCYKAYKEDMTMKERRLFWKDAVHLMILQGGSGINLSLDDDDDDDRKPSNKNFSIDSDDPEWAYLEEEIEEVFKGTGEELKVIVDDFLKNDAPELIDKAMEGLQRFAEELKESLKEK